MKKHFDNLKFADELNRRCALSNVKRFKKNELITTYLIKRNQLCILLTGEAFVIKYLHSGERRIISSLKKGDSFGEVLYKLRNNNDLFVQAKKDCEVLFLPYDKLNTCNKDCFFHIYLLRGLPDLFMNNIIDLNSRIEIMTYKNTRDKLIAYFNLLDKKNGSSKITIPYSFTDLADYLVLDRSAMMRELSKMCNEHLIKKDGKEVTLLYK